MVEDGVQVQQGQPIGTLNSSGNSSGSHLHFAVFKKDVNNTKIAVKPEPLSGYTDIKAGNSYISDNSLEFDTLEKEPSKKISTNSTLPILPTKIKIIFYKFIHPR